MSTRLAGLLACFSLAGCDERPDGFEPVTPAYRERLPGDLVQPLDRQIERVRSAPSNALEHATLGLMYEANKFWTEARECYERAFELEPEQALWALHAGICALEGGDVERARRLYLEGVRRFPDFAPLQQRLGEFLLEAGPFDGARAAFERTIELEPTEPHGYVGLGDVLLREGRHADAVEPLQQALRIEPQYKLAHWLLGMAYRGIGLEADAKRELLRGRNAGRRFLGDLWSNRRAEYTAGPEAGFERAMSLLEAGDLEQAAAVLERVNELYPGEVRSMVNLGVVRARLLDYEAALEILNEAIEIYPRSAMAYINRASTLLALQRGPEALEDAERAVAIAPKMADAHFVRGGVLVSMGETERGLQAMHEARRLDPNNVAIHDRIRALERP